MSKNLENLSVSVLSVSRTEILQPELQHYNPNSAGHEVIPEWRGATTSEMTLCCRAEMNVVDK